MRSLALLSLLVSAPAIAATGAPSVGLVTLAPDSEARWVPFDLTPGNQIRFLMTLDGRPVTAVLDTGVSYSVLARTSTVASDRIEGGGNADAIGGTVPVGWVPTRAITIGGLTRTGGKVSVAALPALATGSARSVDLLVGRDVIGGAALDIDYANRRFRLLPSGRLPFTGDVAPLTLSDARHVYESAIELGGRRFAPMIVDTGDGSALTVTDAGWRDAGLAGVPATTTISYGIAGSTVSTLAIAPSVTIGTRVAHDVEVRVEPAGGFSQSVGVAGRIGSGFLQNYRVLLDPGAGRMVLRPGPGAGRATPRSTSGLLLGLAKGHVRVLHVMQGSPAAAAGWQAGEDICAVDGIAIGADYAASPVATWSIGAPGRRVALTLCDGSNRVLTLARFY